MTQDEINKAFEGRWRIKGKYINDGIILYNSQNGVADAIKSLCRDFFEAGIILGNDDYSVQRENPIPTGRGIITVEEGITHTKELRFKTWWELYDLKCGRKDCLKKWMKMSMLETLAYLS